MTAGVLLHGSAGYVPVFNDEPFAHHWFEKQLPNAVRG
jgi:hypothetical protein